MLKKAVIFTALLCFGIGNLCFADSSRMLDKNTELHPQGWSVGETIKFKKKTAVRLNDIGEVISGMLADDVFPYSFRLTGNLSLSALSLFATLSIIRTLA